MQKYINLFKPLKIKNTIFKNRIFSAPNLIPHVDLQGLPTDYLIAFYEEKARGGAAQVTVGDTPIDNEHAAAHAGQLTLNNNSLSLLNEMVVGIKAHGAVASIELNHCGSGISMKALVIPEEKTSGVEPIGPVGFVREKDGVQVIPMDLDMINHVADNFASAATLVKKAGFDMCMIHGGHGWLLDQFLSPHFNTRTDEFGGSLENRAKFPIMVLKRVREAVGTDFLIEYRMSGSECLEGGLTTEEAVAFAKMIEDKVDLIHVSAGIVSTKQHAAITHPTMFLPHGVNVKYAEAVKKAVNIPVVTVGAITDPDFAEQILAEGRADIISMARALIADPYFPKKAKAGREKEIVPCLRCLDCLTGIHTGSKFNCAVNPWAGREHHMRTTIQPATESLRVLVIGGGPGGMMAAVTAAERGHKVTLAEKNDSLGGLLKFTEYDDLKSDLKRLKNQLIHKVTMLGIDVRLNTEVTPKFIADESPDAVIAAVGSEPIRPAIEGVDMARHAVDIYTDLEAMGKKVVVIGGGLVGCETGLYLAELGKDVIIIEMLDAIAPEANWMHYEGMIAAMDKNQVTRKMGLKCTKITPEGVYAQNAEGIIQFIEADTVVYAVGMNANTETVESLRDGVSDFIAIGDCVKARRVKEAIYEGYFAAVSLA